MFESAKKKDKVKFLTSCLTIYHDQNSGLDIINYTVDYEVEELLSLINDFIDFEKNDSIQQQTKLRLFLFIYCHVIEVSLIYLVLHNMLNTIRGADYTAVIKFKTEIGKEKEATLSYKKIEIIKENAKNTNVNIAAVFEEFFDNRLRNAFVHSDYYIDNSGELSITEHLSPTSSRIGKKRSGPKIYSFEDAKDKYDKSLLFLKSFIKVYKSYVREFQDGNSYPTIYGDVFFDIDLGRWRASKEC